MPLISLLTIFFKAYLFFGVPISYRDVFGLDYTSSYATTMYNNFIFLCTNF